MVIEGLPDYIQNEDQLIQVMTTPRPVLVNSIKEIKSPLIILGVGGKMGPTLAVLAKQAAKLADHQLDVIGVSRFTNQEEINGLHSNGVQTISCDLMNPDNLSDLPDSDHIVYLVGMKFGTIDNPSQTWAINTIIPTNVCRRYPQANIVALSSGNIYPFMDVKSLGATEKEQPAPVGEYASSVLGRERIFEYFSKTHQQPISLIRLNYALDLRYGVLVDLTERIINRQPIDLTVAFVNCIWQGDANEMILRSFSFSNIPPRPINITSPESFSVKMLAIKLGNLLDIEPIFSGEEGKYALLSNPSLAKELFGEPPTQIERVINWTAYWAISVKKYHNIHTHFNTVNGKY